MRHLFIIDPPTKLDLPRDTSFLLMRECFRRSQRVCYCTAGELMVLGRAGAVDFSAFCHQLSFDKAGVFHEASCGEEKLAAFDMLHIRKDPPFDDAYLYLCLCLQMLQGPIVLNNPGNLARYNEKLSILLYPEFITDTVVSAQAPVLAAFAEKVGGQAVMKTLGDAAGRGVRLVGPGDAKVFDELTRGGLVPVMAQRFLPQIYQGETRIFLLDGEPLCWIRKFPPPGSFKANFDPGSRGERCELSSADLAICAALKPFLRQQGFVLVAIDIIDGLLSEINVTSPGLLVETNAINGSHSECAVVDCFERLWAAGKEVPGFLGGA